MAYTKVNWANGEAGGKKMNATNFGNMDNGIAANDSAIGDLSTLNTAAKDNLVSAINENVSKIGDLSALNTTVKNNLVSSVNEVVENVAKGNFTISKSGDWTIKKYDNASKTQAAKIEILARSILAYENIELNNKSENRELIGKLPSAIIDEMYKKQSQLQNDVNDSFSTMDEDLKN